MPKSRRKRKMGVKSAQQSPPESSQKSNLEACLDEMDDVDDQFEAYKERCQTSQNIKNGNHNNNNNNNVNLSKLELFLRDINENVICPLKSSKTPYKLALDMVSDYGRNEPLRVLAVLPKDVIVINPENENEFETKTLALKLFIELRNVPFQVFDDVFRISRTEQNILCEVFAFVFSVIEPKSGHVQSFLGTWIHIGACGRLELTNRFMIQAFFRFDFGPSTVRKCASVNRDLYVPFLQQIDAILKDPNQIIQEFSDPKLTRQIVQKKCKQTITHYYDGRRPDKRLTPNYYRDSFMGKVNYYWMLRGKQEMSQPAFFEMLRLIGREDPDVYSEILAKFRTPQDRAQFENPPLLHNTPKIWTLGMGEARNSRYYMGNRNNRGLLIYHVDDYRSMEEMIRSLVSSRSRVIGFDAEWLPIQESQTADIALFQVSNATHCFLIDTMVLSRQVDLFRPLWSEFFRQVLNNPQFTKVGFSYNEDLRRLASLVGIQLNSRDNVLDLNTVNGQFKRFLETATSRNAFELDNLRRRQQTIAKRKFLSGLSSMVFLLFGRELDKREQISHWEQRPLRREQQIYAALDAYCLVDIHSRLNHLARNVFAFYGLNEFLDHLTGFPVPKQNQE